MKSHPPAKSFHLEMAEGSHMTEKIWSLTLEIIGLLSGECYPAVKSGDHVTITVTPPPSSLTPEILKILKVANKITELLIAEVIVKCQDVGVCRSVEERKCPRRNKEPAMEDQPRPPSMGGATPATSPLPLSQDSIQEGHLTPHHYQVRFPDDLHILVKKEEELVLDSPAPVVEGEDLCDEVELEHPGVTPETPTLCPPIEEAEPSDMMGEETPSREEIPQEINSDGRYIWRRPGTCPDLSPDCKIEEVLITPDLHCLDGSCDPAGQWQRLSDHSAPQHTGKSSYLCPLCGKCFTYKSCLIRHKRVHSGERPYFCSTCGKCFTCKSDLTKHERFHTEKKPFFCLQCGKRFSQKSDLKKHERIHTGEKPFSCAECGKCFSERSVLIKHGRVHTGEKPYSCAECGKCFSEKSVLTKHNRVHTGEKPYSCTLCGKSFSEKSVLIKHHRIHTGEKPYSCAECGKCFADRSALIRHRRIHTGEKPYSCSECGKCFSQKSDLIKHGRLHTGVKVTDRTMPAAERFRLGRGRHPPQPLMNIPMSTDSFHSASSSLLGNADIHMGWLSYQEES